MKPFIVTIKYSNGEFVYLAFAEDKTRAKRKAQGFGVHCQDKKAICPPFVTVEPVTAAFECGRIPAVSRIR